MCLYRQKCIYGLINNNNLKLSKFKFNDIRIQKQIMRDLLKLIISKNICICI